MRLIALPYARNAGSDCMQKWPDATRSGYADTYLARSVRVAERARDSQNGAGMAAASPAA